MEWSHAWSEADASAEVVVRAFLSAETDPNDSLAALLDRTSTKSGGEDRRAMRLDLAAKFEAVVGGWAAENDISAQAFLRLGIQPGYLTGVEPVSAVGDVLPAG